MEDEREMTVREYLSLTQSDRFEEELTRPRVEILPDEWADWVASHDEDNYYFACYAGGKGEPLLPNRLSLMPVLCERINPESRGPRGSGFFSYG
jgi:hypothetical protein